MDRRRRWTRALAVLALGAGLMVVPTASAQRAPEPNFPNLPAQQNPGASLMSSGYVSNTAYVGPAKQWVQVLDMKVTADVAIMSASNTANCERVFGDGSPRCRIEQPGAINKNALRALAYPVDFRGDDVASPPSDRSELRRIGARFTDFPSQRVRMLAFGAIPVEATLHLSLPTDDAGLPYGIQADADNFQYGNRAQDVTDTVGSGQLELRLSDLVVDGVPTAVGAGCRLVEPGRLALKGTGFRGGLNEAPPGTYNPNFGGLLQGTLSVGRFSGCGEGGDDLSPLVNAMAGESEVPVRIVQAEVKPTCFTNLLRLPIAESTCQHPDDQPIPEGEQLPDLPPSYLPAPPVD